MDKKVGINGNTDPNNIAHAPPTIVPERNMNFDPILVIYIKKNSQKRIFNRHTQMFEKAKNFAILVVVHQYNMKYIIIVRTTCTYNSKKTCTIKMLI